MSQITQNLDDNLKKLEKQLKKKKKSLSEQGIDDFILNRDPDKLDSAYALNQQIRALEEQRNYIKGNMLDNDRPLHKESDPTKKQFVAEEKKRGEK